MLDFQKSLKFFEIFFGLKILKKEVRGVLGLDNYFAPMAA
jgi:hypothetical protein